MKKYYTAVGKFEMRKHENGQEYPIVFVRSHEQILDIQEMVIWSILNWRLLTAKELKEFYKRKTHQMPVKPARDFQACLDRLKQRGLVEAGTGETQGEALYDLLGGLHIIPLVAGPLTRLFNFTRAVLFHRVPIQVAKSILGSRPRNKQEVRVLRLARQAFLTTAEIISCVERQIDDISTDDKIMDALYADEHTTCDNLIDLARRCPSRPQITQAIADLYTRRQLILERF